MTARVEIPESVERADRPRPEGDPDPSSFEPFDGDQQVPPMAAAGDGYRVHVTGLTHDERGYPDIEPATQERMLGRMMSKIQDNRDDIVDVERYQLDDAEVGVVAYGSTGRAARQAVRELRADGIAAGLLRVRTVWPFPIKTVEVLADQVESLVVAEMNLGQYGHRVREHADCEVVGHTHSGGEIPQPRAIAETVQGVAP